MTTELNRWSDLLAKVWDVFANIAIVAALRTGEQVLDAWRYGRHQTIHRSLPMRRAFANAISFERETYDELEKCAALLVALVEEYAQNFGAEDQESESAAVGSAIAEVSLAELSESLPALIGDLKGPDSEEFRAWRGDFVRLIRRLAWLAQVKPRASERIATHFVRVANRASGDLLQPRRYIVRRVRTSRASRCSRRRAKIAGVRSAGKDPPPGPPGERCAGGLLHTGPDAIEPPGGKEVPLA